MYKYIHIIIVIKTNIPTYTHTPVQTKCLHNDDDDPPCAALTVTVIYFKIRKKTSHLTLIFDFLFLKKNLLNKGETIQNNR